MQHLKIMHFVLLSAGMISIFPGDGAAQNSARTSQTARAGSAAEQPFRVERATSLIGKQIINQQGEFVGQIDELVVDPENQSRVSYAVVSFGESVGTANKRTAVPLSALNLQPDGQNFVISLTDEQRRDFPMFEQDKWPTMDDPTWANRTYEYFGQRPYWIRDDGDAAVGSNIKLRSERVRELIGRPVQNSRGQIMGRVEDFVVDPDTGRIAYNVLSLEGTPNAANRYYVVPTSTLQFPATGRSAIFNVEEDRLKNAPGFDRSRWPKLAEPAYATTVYQHYGLQPYWIEGDPNTAVQNQQANSPDRSRSQAGNATNRPKGSNPTNSQNPANPVNPNPPKEKP